MTGTWRTFSTVGLLLGAGSAVGCSAPPGRSEPPVDCAAGDDYEFQMLRDFEDENLTWYPGSDGTGLMRCETLEQLLPDDMSDAEKEAQVTPLMVEDSVLCEPRVRCDDKYAIVSGSVEPAEVSRTLCESTYSRRAVAEVTIESLPDGLRCGSEYGLRLVAERNNDWGSLFGDYELSKVTTDASDHAGLALWARASYATSQAVEVILDDKYTRNIRDDDGGPADGQESVCVDEEIEDDGTVVVQGNQSGMVSGGGVITGQVPSEDACGNQHTRLLRVTNDWQLYLLPFDSFSQEPLPNRRLEGIDATSIRGITFRAQTGSVLDLWIDDIAFYRPLDN